VNPHRAADGRASRHARFGVRAAMGRIALLALCVAPTGCEQTPAEDQTSTPRVTEAGLRSINGTELYVKRMGSGPPVVVVHGGPVLEHGYLLPHLEPLARSYELILFDQRLSGRSAGTVDSASVRLHTFVADIEALRQSLGFERIHLLGHSWGGLLAMRYAIAHTERLSSLILVSPMSASAALWQEEERVLAARMTAADSAERAALLADPGLAERRPEAVRRMLLLSFGLQFHDRSRLAELELYDLSRDPREPRNAAVLAFVRELLGTGMVRLFGMPIVPRAVFQPAIIMILPPGAFVTLGLMMALMNKIGERQQG